MAKRTYQDKSLAFTVVELLTVVAIIVILASIVFPVYNSAKRSGFKAVVASNLSQLNRTFVLYASDYDDRTAYATDFCTSQSCAILSAVPSIKVALKPYGYKEDLVIVPVGKGLEDYRQYGTSLSYALDHLAAGPLSGYDANCPVFFERNSYLYDNGQLPRTVKQRWMTTFIGGQTKFTGYGELFDFGDVCRSQYPPVNL